AVVYHHQRVIPRAHWRVRAYVMNADGSVINLTNNAAPDRDPAWSREVWPNEPAGFIPFNDQPWNDLLGSWSWLRRGSSKDPDIVADSTARFSPQNVLRMIFTPDMENGSEPSVHWIGLPGADEIISTCRVVGNLALANLVPVNVLHLEVFAIRLNAGSRRFARRYR